jgi:hypothetical protein
MENNTPEFPIITWKAAVPANVVNVTYNSSTFTGTMAADDHWGYASAVGGDADVDSLMYVLAAVVQDVMTDAAKHNVAAAVITPAYEWTTSGDLILRGKLTASGFAMATSIVVTMATATEPTFGLAASGNYTISSVTSIGRSDWSLAGYWAPYNKTVWDDRDYENTSFSAQSLSGDSLSVVKWGDTKTYRILQFPTVYAAYVYAYRKELAVFADVARVDSADPNNLLENLQVAAAASNTNFKFRTYQDDGEYRLGYLVEQDLLNSMKGFVEDISARGAIFQVSIPFRDLGNDGTGAN